MMATQAWKALLRPGLLAVGLLSAGVVLGVLLRDGASPASGQSTAQADPSVSAFDEVDECDLLAAHPSDPERVAEGVADDAIIPRLAVMACEAAIRRSPGTQRFPFQLGRAHLAAGRYAAAAAHFHRAGDYGAALAYLGDAYQFGQGVEADAARALSAYEQARAKGFAPAAGQIEMLTFTPAAFVIEGVVEALHNGDIASLRTNLSNQNGPLIRAYLFSFTTVLNAECVSAVRPSAMEALFRLRYPANWQPQEDDRPDINIMGSVAEQDARTFLRRHGCEGPVATRVKDALGRLLVS